MLKKLINYAAVFSLFAALVSPSLTQAGSISISSQVANLTSGSNQWTTSVSAKPGDNIAFNSILNNDTGATATSLMFRALMPSALQYVSGSARLYYQDPVSGEKKNVGLSDAVFSSGVSIADLPTNFYSSVAYRVNVINSAVSGTYSTTNQVASPSGLNISANNASVSVTGAAVSSTPSQSNTQSNNNTQVNGVDNSQVSNPAAAIVSALYNVTRGETNYSTSTTAKPGDEIIYRVKLSNIGNSTLSGLGVKVILPSALQYVNDTARMLYTDANGTDKTLALNDSIVTNGSSMLDVPVQHYVYIVYRVQVKADAQNGTYGTSTQVANQAGLNVSANNATVDVTGVANEAKLSLIAKGYNVTQNQNVAYSNSVNAKRGDEIKFKIDLANAGVNKLTNVKITSSLPDGLEYVNGSLKVVIAGNTISVPDNKVINLGDLNVGANGYIEFNAKVKSNVANNVANLVYSANGNADGISQVSSIVTINLDTKTSTDTLPSTGPATMILALILLALFTSIAGYVYFKESNGLKRVLGLIKR